MATTTHIVPQHDTDNSFRYQLLPELAEFGARRLLSGNFSVPALIKGMQIFALDNGIDYELELTNTGEGILLRGTAKAAGKTECARCLEQADFDVCGDVESYYVLSSHRLDHDESDDEYIVLDGTGVVDLFAPIQAAIIFELPQVILCKEDCAGLCPSCGVNLNNESCGCSSEIDPSNPFYALRDLKR